MATNTQIDGTLQLPDGRTIPVVVSLDLAQMQGAPTASADQLTLRAIEVFGKTDKAMSWLSTANPELGNLTPRESARTSAGLDRVLGVLFDLEYGFPA
jgi:uncharacterized protein (DUF2384 family)